MDRLYDQSKAHPNRLSCYCTEFPNQADLRHPRLLHTESLDINYFTAEVDDNIFGLGLDLEGGFHDRNDPPSFWLLFAGGAG